jgi:hypothetical protein
MEKVNANWKSWSCATRNFSQNFSQSGDKLRIFITLFSHAGRGLQLLLQFFFVILYDE